jgi:hypothetical protein
MKTILILSVLLNFDAFCAEKVRIGYSEVLSRLAPQYIDIVEKIYSNIGVEVENIILPSSRAVNYFETGKVDALGIRIDGYSEINKDALFIKTKVLDNNVTRAWVLKSRKEEILKQDHVSYLMLRGDISPKVYQLKMKIKYDNTVSSLPSAISMITKKRADAFVGTSAVLKFFSNANQFVPLDDKKVVHSLHHFIHVSKKHLLAPLNNEFLKAEKNGLFKRKKKVQQDNLLE